MNLNIHYITSDGESGILSIVSDESWFQNIGPITMDDIYNGYIHVDSLVLIA